MSAALLSRIARKDFHKYIVPAQATLEHFQHGQSVGWSGFSATGYPKAVPAAVAQHVEDNNLQGKLQFDLYVGASVGAEVEDRWARNKMTRQRWPFQSSKELNKEINSGRTKMGDIHLSSFAYHLSNGMFNVHDHKFVKSEYGQSQGFLDIAVIEASEITADGGIVLTGAVGIAPEIADMAKKIIIEVNTRLPSYKGWHDIIPELSPPFRKPFLINRVDDRIGNQTVRFDHAKLVGIVESTSPDSGAAMKGEEGDESASGQIGKHVIAFLENEVRHNRLPKNLLPLQSGIGNIANSVISNLVKGPFEKTTVWTEVQRLFALLLVYAKRSRADLTL